MFGYWYFHFNNTYIYYFSLFSKTLFHRVAWTGSVIEL